MHAFTRDTFVSPTLGTNINALDCKLACAIYVHLARSKGSSAVKENVAMSYSLDEDDLWLQELLCPRPVCEGSDNEASQWLNELLSCHRSSPPANIAQSSRKRSRSPALAHSVTRSRKTVVGRHIIVEQGPIADPPAVVLEPPRRSLDWVSKVPADALSLPRTFEVMNEIACQPQIELRLRRSPLAGVQLEHAVSVVRATINPLTRFKIGITSSPMHRWENVAYGYRKDKYDRMIILNVATQPDSSCMLEASLIKEFGKVRGCQNIARGGEGKKCLLPCFTYVVVQQLQ